MFMGMGEPLANYEAVLRALEQSDFRGGDELLPSRRVTVSTCGLVPKIRRLGKEARVNLAVSLNASDDETRSSRCP
ncbi:MAG: hypothetical protein MZV70_45860 [Desulfobacterales bacterium]|nr:hypothetical protein [Desulfobacterales bacterium]